MKYCSIWLSHVITSLPSNFYIYTLRRKHCLTPLTSKVSLVLVSSLGCPVLFSINLFIFVMNPSIFFLHPPPFLAPFPLSSYGQHHLLPQTNHDLFFMQFSWWSLILTLFWLNMNARKKTARWKWSCDLIKFLINGLCSISLP